MIDREQLLDALGERADRADDHALRFPSAGRNGWPEGLAQGWREAFDLVATLTRPKEAQQ